MEEKNNNNTVIVLLVVIIILMGVGLGYFIGKGFNNNSTSGDNNSNNSSNNSQNNNQNNNNSNSGEISLDEVKNKYNIYISKVSKGNSISACPGEITPYSYFKYFYNADYDKYKTYIIDETEKYVDEGLYSKTIYKEKYADFKNKLLNIMSETLFYENYPSNVFYADANGNLVFEYTEEGCGGDAEILKDEVYVSKTNDGYIGTRFTYRGSDVYEGYYIDYSQNKFTAKLVNGNIIIDSVTKYNGALDSNMQKIYDELESKYGIKN